MRPLVLIDGSNVRRSGWPNASEAALVAALEAWSGELAEEVDVTVVFDGDPELASTERVSVVGAGYADDELVAQVVRGRADGREVRVATSDRELRARIEAAGGAVVWGGGSMLRTLGLARGRGG